jgi:hypothetical protein
MTASQCARGDIQDSHVYLLEVSDQGSGHVEYFGSTGLWTQLHQAIFHSKGALQLSRHHSLTLCRYHLIIDHYQAGRSRPRLGAP